MDHWDLLLIGIALYVAVITLTRLMAKRRNRLIQQIHQNVQDQLNRRSLMANPSDAESVSTKQEEIVDKEVA